MRLRTVRLDTRQRCPFCYEQVAPRQALCVCPRCDTVLHALCWSELRGCPTAGCWRPRARGRELTWQTEAEDPDGPVGRVRARTPTEVLALGLRRRIGWLRSALRLPVWSADTRRLAAERARAAWATLRAASARRRPRPSRRRRPPPPPRPPPRPRGPSPWSECPSMGPRPPRTPARR